REPLEAAEKVNLVLHDRAAHGAAPALVLRVRFRQTLFLREEVLRRQVPILEEGKPGAAELVGARLGNGVDYRTRGAAVLRVVLAGDDLEFLNRFNPCPRLSCA